MQEVFLTSKKGWEVVNATKAFFPDKLLHFDILQFFEHLGKAARAPPGLGNMAVRTTTGFGPGVSRIFSAKTLQELSEALGKRTLTMMLTQAT